EMWGWGVLEAVRSATSNVLAAANASALGPQKKRRSGEVADAEVVAAMAMRIDTVERNAATRPEGLRRGASEPGVSAAGNRNRKSNAVSALTRTMTTGCQRNPARLKRVSQLEIRTPPTAQERPIRQGSEKRR